MAVIEHREIPHVAKVRTNHILSRGSDVTKPLVMYSGCTTTPTRRSETARLPNKSMDGVRSEGVFDIAASIKALPIVATSIKGTFMARFMRKRESLRDILGLKLEAFM